MAVDKLEFLTEMGEYLPEITCIGRSIFDPVYAEEEHVDKSSELIHFLHGRGEVRTRDFTIYGKEGDSIYLPADVPHRDIFEKGYAFEAYLVQFRWAGEESLLKAFHPSQLADISEPGKLRIAAEFQSLFSDFSDHMPFGAEMTSLNILRIIAIMCREAGNIAGMEDLHSSDVGKPRRVQLMMQAKRIIMDKFNEPINLALIASQLNISSYYLSRVFSEESGFRLSSYLTQIRMEKAVAMLDDSRLNLAEVGRAVGFSDSHYFGQVFKAYFGISPKVYRAKLLPDQD